MIQSAKAMDPLEVLNESDRIFRCWGSVEIKDRDGQILPINEFKKIMPVMMKRGGVIMSSHTNKHVGKLLNYEFKDKNDSPGVLLTGQVFSDYPIDNVIWDQIKSGRISGMSFGGANLDKEYDFTQNAEILKDLNGFEWSLVERPANQEALMEEVNFLAKSEVQKPFAGYKDFQDCVNQNKDKKDPNAYCAVIMRAVEKAEEDTEKDLNKETNKTSNNSQMEEIIMNSETKKEEGMVPSEENTPETECKQEEPNMQNDLSARVSNLEAKVDKIIEMLAPAPKAEGSKEQIAEPAAKSADEQITKFKETMKEEVNKMVTEKVEEVKKSLNLNVISGSRPNVGENNITKDKSGISPLDIAQGRVKVDMGQIIQKKMDDNEDRLKEILGY